MNNAGWMTMCSSRRAAPRAASRRSHGAKSAVVAICGWLLSACWSVPAAAADTGEGLALLQQFVDDTRTLRAEFEQQLIDAEGVIAQQSSGTLWIERPDRFRWDYREPYAQVIVSDGERLWYYDSDLQQATVKPLDQTLATTPAMLLSGAEGISDRFEVLGTRHEEGRTWVDLRPREEDTDFRQLSVGFVENELSSMQLLDTLDQLTLLQFHSLVRNPTLEAGLFDFEPPPGVDVIGESGAAP